jgi:hypothetical protein
MVKSLYATFIITKCFKLKNHFIREIYNFQITTNLLQSVYVGMNTTDVNIFDEAIIRSLASFEMYFLYKKI